MLQSPVSSLCTSKDILAQEQLERVTSWLQNGYKKVTSTCPIDIILNNKYLKFYYYINSNLQDFFHV